MKGKTVRIVIRIVILLVFTVSMSAIDAMAGDSPYQGDIIMYAGSRIPTGWMQCQGQLINISENQALFSLIGTIYGGDGRNTFALPDLRGRMPRGVNSDSSNTALVPLASTGGAETVAVTADQLPSHNHTLLTNTSVTATNAAGTVNTPKGSYFAAFAMPRSTTQSNIYSTSSNAKSLTGILSGNTTSTGSSQPHANMPPYFGMNFLIAVSGIYPVNPN